MKHPELRVKKGTSSYDDREDSIARERDEQRQERRPVRRGGAFSLLRIRRGSMLPLLILVLIAFLLLRYLPGSAARANFAGWRAVLQSRVLGDSLRVGVAFSRLGGGPQEAVPLVSVLFVLPDTGEQTTASGVLGEPRVVLRSQMRYLPGERTLRAIVRIDGESRILSVAIRGP